MKRIKYILLFIFFIKAGMLNAQWMWALASDRTNGNQSAVRICKNASSVYVLLYQDGSSVINGTTLDSGYVILKLGLDGDPIWARNYPGRIGSIHSDSRDNIFLIGTFSGTLDFMGSALVSNGWTDIFFSKLSPSGDKVWVRSAGGAGKDEGRSVITDESGNIYLAGKIADDYNVGAQHISGRTGYRTYILKCDAGGDYINSHMDDTLQFTGKDFQTDRYGNIYLSAEYTYDIDCYYACMGSYVMKFDRATFAQKKIKDFPDFDYLEQYLVKDDLNLTAMYNTGSHYLRTADVFDIDISKGDHTHRKYLGDFYDMHRFTFLNKGIGDEVVATGNFSKNVYNNGDTLRFDSYTVIPDSLQRFIIGGFGADNKFKWLYTAGGESNSCVNSVITDGRGSCYLAGTYNYWTYYSDSVKGPLILGNHSLPVNGFYSRFFVARLDYPTEDITSIAPGKEGRIMIYPNPARGDVYLDFGKIVPAARVKVYSAAGSIVFSGDYGDTGSETIKLPASDFPPGVYFVECHSSNEIFRGKMILVR